MNFLTLERPCGCIKDGRDGTFLHYCRKHEPESHPAFVWTIAIITAIALATLFGELTKRDEIVHVTDCGRALEVGQTRVNKIEKDFVVEKDCDRLLGLTP